MIHKVKQPRIDGANVSLILGHFQKCLTGGIVNRKAAGRNAAGSLSFISDDYFLIVTFFALLHAPNTLFPLESDA